VVVNKYYALIADREQTYTEGNLIEHGDVPGQEYIIIYDFFQHMSDANIQSAKGVPIQTQIVEIQSIPRKVIFAHPPSQIIFTVHVESGVSLAFAIGILPTAWEKIPQGVKFDIDVVSEGSNESLFSRVLMPKRNIGDRGWHNFIFSLEKFSGKRVSFRFSTSGSGEDLSYCWSAWGWVKIIQLNTSTDASPPLDNSESMVTNDTDEILNNPGGVLRYGNKKAIIENVELLNCNGSPQLSFKTGERITIRYSMIAHMDFDEDLTIGFIIRNKFTEVYGTNTRWRNCDLSGIKKGQMPVVTVSMDLLLGTGTYSLTSAIAIVHPGFVVEVLDRMEDHMIFHVQNNQVMSGFADLQATFMVE
jgi:hypothetical protein